MTLALPDVTLCAVTAINHDLTVRAMEECLRHCSFADVVLISDKPVKAPFHVEVVPSFTGPEYGIIVCRDLAKYTPSAFNLLVQYDGYIINPSAWSDEFFNYDYIGAKWPWHPANRRVGNSGFCLRSKKLLDVMATYPLPPVGHFVDDEFICHAIRTKLENDHDIRVAPDNIADKFSYERHTPDQPTFGFHGLFNFWHHKSDEEMLMVLDLLDEYYVTSRPYAEIIFRYYVLKKFSVFDRYYHRLRERIGVSHIKEHLLNYVRSHDFVDEVIKIGEAHEAAGA